MTGTTLANRRDGFSPSSTARRPWRAACTLGLLLLAAAVGQAQNVWSGSPVSSFCVTCNVGIGTSAPSSLLHIVNQGVGLASSFFEGYSVPPHLGFRYARGTVAQPTPVLSGDTLGSISGRGYGATGFSTGRGRIDFLAAENWTDAAQGASLAFNTTARGTTTLTERMRIDPGGTVLIGTTTSGTCNPAPCKLWVQGSVGGTNITAQYQDVAEWVPARQRVLPGTVVVVDADRSNGVLAASVAYDTKVAGVISARPGIVLGEAGDGKQLVATTGRLKVFVDATKNPSHAGDLLVTSDREGYAMRSEPIDVAGVKIHRPGTLIGKALEPLASGTGEILILLSLQ